LDDKTTTLPTNHPVGDVKKAEAKPAFAPKAPETKIIVMNPQLERALRRAEAKGEAAKLKLDFAPEGGRYERGGVLVDADGNAVKAKSEESDE
jgi:hypothetical protein